jgi:tRNA-Thr(GGU) m(6)t(6)A37 methyltransferase TsaA
MARPAAEVYDVEEPGAEIRGPHPRIELPPIGTVESPLTDRASAPKQGHEGSPEAWLVFEPSVAEGLDGIRPGDEVLVLTWLDRAHRDVLRVHPRGDLANAQQGVFNTRSPDRPNPIGLHQVEVVAVDGNRLLVRNLEALDGTPIVDVKPVLGPSRRPGRRLGQ